MTRTPSEEGPMGGRGDPGRPDTEQVIDRKEYALQ